VLEVDGGPELELENMHNTECVWQILLFLQSPVVRITRCRLDPDYHCHGCLYLKEIDGGEDLVAFLGDCAVGKLVIDDCPGFGDDVLYAMIPAPQPETSDSTVSYCVPYVEYLWILNCPDFSISALKQVVETRRIRDMSQLSQPPHICILQLSGCVPEVSPEDRDWFEGCLSQFIYNPIQ
jgi:hypothetical protein